MKLVLYLVICISFITNLWGFTEIDNLIKAIRMHSNEEAIHLIHNSSVNINGHDRAKASSPIIEAAMFNNVIMTNKLLQLGANSNKQNIAGATALHVSCRKGHFEIADLLIHNGALLDIQDNQGWTSIMKAVAHNNISIVDLLIKAGANVQIKDIKGRTALIHAIYLENMNLIKKVFICDASIKGELSNIINAAKGKSKPVRMLVKQLLEGCINNHHR